MPEAMPPRVRFAPSPTGDPHIGNIRAAIFNWLFARHEGGTFVVRIEDTDRNRYVPGALESILGSLRWLGLNWDEGPEVGGPYGPYFQSERLSLYREAVGRLLDNDFAYECYCSPERLARVRKEQQQRKEPPKYDRYCRDATRRAEARAASGKKPVVRFQTPLSGETECHDLVRGDLRFANETLDDFVLLKSDGYPTYHLANVVDDHSMEISHILRGDEWISSAPRHLLIYQALGWSPPRFVHLPMIMGADGAKLSKRHGDTSVLQFREAGFLSEAMFNFLALLGWSLDDRTEIIDRDLFVRSFKLERILASPSSFNAKKLEWMNGVYIRALPSEDLATAAIPFLEKSLGRTLTREDVIPVIPLIQERIKSLGDVVSMAQFFFLDGELDYDTALLLGKRFDVPAAVSAIDSVIENLQLSTDWEASSLEETLRGLAEEINLKPGDLFGLIRVAITGSTVAPPLFGTMAVLGRERTLARLQVASRRLKEA